MFTEITAANIVAFYETIKDNETAEYLGQVLFPATKQMSLDLGFVKGKSNAPVVLKPSAYDVDVTLRDRIGVELLETEIPFFKEGILLKEKDRRELITLQGNPNQAYYQAALRSVFNDRAVLIDGAEAQAERMRMQLLTQGKIAIQDNKVNLEFDYGFNEANNMLTLTGEDTWDKETASPFEDITSMLDKSDGSLELMVMNQHTWNILKRHKSLREYLGKEVIPTEQTVRAYIENEFGLQVVINNKKYKKEVFGKEEKFFPDGVVSLVPSQIGQTHYAATPEEIDLMGGIGTSASVSVVNLGVAVTTITKADPVNVMTKVSQAVLPSGENIDKVFIINALE